MLLGIWLRPVCRANGRQVQRTGRRQAGADRRQAGEKFAERIYEEKVRIRKLIPYVSQFKQAEYTGYINALEWVLRLMEEV